MLKPGKTYEEVYNSFRWEIPEFYNIGVDVCDKWAEQRERLALIYENEEGEVEKYTFWELKRLSNKLANALKNYGIEQGDRVSILLPQCPETAIAHIAIYKIGAIANPLSVMLGPAALEYRLSNSEAKAIITNGENINKILEIRDKFPNLKLILTAASDTDDVSLDFWNLIEKGSDTLKPVRTRADAPALLIYTSGTTGPPKGALHAHRDLLGHLPGTEFPHNFFPKKGDIIWTPADWSWIAGLMDVLMASWHHGVTVVSNPIRKFDPDIAFYTISKYGVRNALIPPTALKMMRQVNDPKSRYDFSLRTLVSSSESLGGELVFWCKQVLGVQPNELYGQTETHLLIGNCFEIMEINPGSMGKPIPGHELEILNESGHSVNNGNVGEIALKRSTTIMCLGYWKDPDATNEKILGDWWLTGDLAVKDDDGYFWFVGRKDDVINSAGYRIGPGEIEDCLIRHPSVAMAAAVGVPDEERNEVVKAFIILKPDVVPDMNLEDDIRSYVKSKLAAYQYPRKIEFVDEIPMTATGKIMRRQLRDSEREKTESFSQGRLHDQK